MFLMTGNMSFQDITDPSQKKLKGTFNSCTWKNSIDTICSSAEIICPRKVQISSRKDLINTGDVVKPGFMCNIECGYDSKNYLRFSGFVVKTETENNRLKISCEGYSYILRNISFIKSYNNPSLKTILSDLLKIANNSLVNGVKIKLSSKIQDITFRGVFKFTKTGLDVLEYLKQKCLLSAYFIHNELYVGLKFINSNKEIKFQLGWNVIKDNLLTYQNLPSPKNYVINSKEKDGTSTLVSVGNGTTVNLRVDHIFDKNILELIAKDKQKDNAGGRYNGKIEVFAIPFSQITDTANIISKDFPTQNGKYFIDSVEGSFDENGGRQQIGISAKLS